MQIVLLAAGILSLFIPNQVATGVVLIALTLLNAAMGLSQEGKASASVAALQKMMVVKAKARRDGALVEVPMEELVPGDIVNIEAGDLVPADARILTAATLEIDESALTGESVPVPKQVDPVDARCRAGRSRRPRVHEHAGHQGCRDAPGHRDRHGHRGRSHQRHAAGDQGRGHPAHPPAQQADQPDPVDRRHRAGGVDRDRSLARYPVRRVVPHGHRILGIGDPDRAAGRRHRGPVRWDPEAGRRRGDREAPSLGRDTRFDLGDQFGQDRHAHAQSDDSRPDGGRRWTLCDLGRGLFDRRSDHPGRRATQGRPRRALPADGALRRRRGEGRFARRRPDRGRPRRPRREGRGGPDTHS